jgi:hypothetical protein
LELLGLFTNRTGGPTASLPVRNRLGRGALSLQQRLWASHTVRLQYKMTDEPSVPAPVWKEKIGSHLSYVLKFSEVQALLAPAFEQRAIKVSFSGGWKTPRQNEAREAYPVFEAQYSALHPSREEPEWQLSVHPVPRELRSTVRALLIPQATDQMKRWYLANRSSVWLSGNRQLRIRFITATQELAYEGA